MKTLDSDFSMQGVVMQVDPGTAPFQGQVKSGHCSHQDKRLWTRANAANLPAVGNHIHGEDCMAEPPGPGEASFR